jgi:hypothetical protein
MLVSLIDQATHRLGYGATYTRLGGVCAAMLPCILVEIKMVSKWRAVREKTRELS